MSKLGYCTAAVIMLGAAIAVPYMLQDPAPVVSGNTNNGKPMLSGRLDLDALASPQLQPSAPSASPAQPAVQPEAKPAPVRKEAESKTEKTPAPEEKEKVMPPLPSTEAMTMTVDSQTKKSASPKETEAVAKPVQDGQPAESVTKTSAAVEKKAEEKVEEKVGKKAEEKAEEKEEAAEPRVLVTRGTMEALSGKATVTEAVLTMDGNSVVLTLKGNYPLKGKAFLLNNPERAVLDLSGLWKMQAPRVPSNRMVGSLRIGVQPDSTRLVFDMRVKPAKVTVKQLSAQSIELCIR